MLGNMTDLVNTNSNTIQIGHPSQCLKVASALHHKIGVMATLYPEKGMAAKEGGTLWLIELISPFNDDKNNHQQQMLADLMQTRLKGKN